MYCCTVKKETATNKYLETLENNFDEVLITKKEKYQLLTIRDKANKTNYDWIVWLQLKVAYDKTNSCMKTSDEKLEGVLKALCDWWPLLKNPNDSKPKQLSLFGDDEEFEEEEPPAPTGGEDNRWAKYYRECDRIRKANILKKYSFFEVFHDVGEWWHYDDTDFSHMLPKTQEEMKALIKEFISGEIKSKILQYNKIEKEKGCLKDIPLSDYELYQRTVRWLSFDLVPFRKYANISIDNGYHVHEYEERYFHKFHFRGGKIEGSSWDNKRYGRFDLRKDKEFISWLREFYAAPYKESLSDIEVLKKNIDVFFCSTLWHKADEYQWQERINRFENWKQFKSDLNSFLKENNIDGSNGGGSGYSVDGYDAWYNKWKKGNIKISQDKEYRAELGRQTEELEIDDYDRVVVFDISGDEIYKKAYELFYTSKTPSLFDLVA
ncbi:hypothetical protein [Sulfurimonas indica]|uniref:hypothetical protein n=1 Tax=Sulfurimonas TaxID=202746 RepID=UPI001264D901|nr:hypothetical protein [Sulfurimonas indica]